MNRRDFIKSAFAGGALIATADLPSLAKDDPSLFPERGKYERLSLSCATVRIGAEKPFAVLHISDTHLCEAYDDEGEVTVKLRDMRRRTFGGRQEEALADSIAWAKRNVDYILHTGDLIDFQSRANFDLVRKHFGDAMFGALGNHEFARHMWLAEEKEPKTEEWKDRTRAKLDEVFPFDVVLHSQVVNGVNFVTLDDVYGTVTERQVERFRAEVAKGLPIVLCMHVPFFTDDIWRATTQFWARSGSRFGDAAVPPRKGDYQRQSEDPVTRDFIAYLRKEPLLKAILAGHEHVTIQDRFSETADEYVVGANFLFAAREVLFI
jgi:hypothetical protein